MFIINKYYTVYFNIIGRALSRKLPNNIYSEKHHIIPKSIGGSNNNDNLVRLTAREHFICHLLLPKMVSGDHKRKMKYAAWQLCNQKNKDQQRYVPSSRIYEIIKTERSEIMKSSKGPTHPNYGRKTGRTNKDFTPEWKTKISESCKGRVPWNKGLQRTQEVKDAISKANKGRPAWNKGITRHWINNNSKNKLVYPHDLDSYLSSGWSRGRITY